MAGCSASLPEKTLNDTRTHQRTSHFQHHLPHILYFTITVTFTSPVKQCGTVRISSDGTLSSLAVLFRASSASSSLFSFITTIRSTLVMTKNPTGYNLVFIRSEHHPRKHSENAKLEFPTPQIVQFVIQSTFSGKKNKCLKG